MIALKKIIPLYAALVLFSSPLARAEIASGDYTLSFNGDVNLWDISGTYNESLGLITLNYSLNMDSSGKFTGDGSANYDDGANILNMDILFSGAVKSAGDVVRVSMKMAMAGSGVVEDPDGNPQNATFTASIK